MTPIRAGLMQHGSKAANDKFIRVCEAEISSKTCTNLTVWFGAANIGKFLKISWPRELGSTYCLLRWNHVAKPLLLHTMQMI